MNRRQLLQLAPAAVGTFWIGEAAAQGTPPATPIASPEVSALPQVYSDVARAYDALAGRVLEEGRAAVDLLLNGEFDALIGRSTSEMQSMYTKEDLSALIPSFTTDQVHFEIPEYRLVFDAQVTGNFMTGVIQSGDLTVFNVARQGRPPSSSPVAGTPFPTALLAGHWTGTSTLPPDDSLQIELTFSDDGQRGTFSVPEQGLVEAPLSNITFHAQQPLGERTADRGVPLAPDLHYYWARYDWGGRGLLVKIGFDDTGALIAMLINPEWQLPPDPAADLPPLPPLRLPFDGLWWIFWGGEAEAENYHASTPQQRHALDLVIWNEGGTYHDDPGKNENYWIWGQPVLAPADGTVVTIVDGVDANVPGVLPTGPAEIAGNHVVIQIGDEAYAILAHMQRGSISVKDGEMVTAGTKIGLVGNSGNSSEPHLHIHVMNEPDLASPTTFSLPITFADIVVNGETREESPLQQGVFVSPA